jgi:hypothetical protein
MPLIPSRVTIASRVMLPAHAAFSLYVGFTWVFQADIRTQVPALYALRDLWPIDATGGVILAVGALQLIGMSAHHRAVEAITLIIGCLAYLLLGAAIAASVWTQPASYSAPAWPIYVALAHLASALSLVADEWTDAQGINRRGLAS